MESLLEAPRTVILTRPIHRNQVLAKGLSKLRVKSLSLPALQLQPLQKRLPPSKQPTAYDLVVFVSGAAAVNYLRSLWQEVSIPWPLKTRIGTVGVSTRKVAEQCFQQHGADTSGLQWRHPPSSEPNHDSEQLWLLLKPELPFIRRVLIVRGTTGREWLKKQFEQQKILVDVLPVYQRQANCWSIEQAKQLKKASALGLVFLVTSSESAQAIFANLERLSMLSICQKSIFVVIHERIEKQVQSLYQGAGFKTPAVVKRCVPTSESMLSALGGAALCA